MHSPIIGVIGAVFIFGLAIFVHELGHFIFAKLGGVGVKEFAIGMGPKLVSILKGGTYYSIRAIPFGGFVMMEGAMPEGMEEEAKENPDKGKFGQWDETGFPTPSPEKEGKASPDEGNAAEAAVEDKAPAEEKKSLGGSVMEDVDALRDKPMYVKIPIFAAGVGFNFLAAMFAIGLIFSVGFTQDKPFPARVGEVKEGTPLYDLGLRFNDRIVSVDGAAINDWDEFQLALAGAAEASDDAMRATVVERDGQQIELELPPLLESGTEDQFNAAYRENPDDPKSLALAPLAPAYIGAVWPTRAADRAKCGDTDVPDGLRKGDTILAVNDQPVQYFTEMADIIRNHANDAIKITVQRKGYDKPLDFYPVVEKTEKTGTGQIGIFAGNPDKDFIKEPVWRAFAHAPRRAVEQTARIGGATFTTLGRLFTDFKAAKKEVGGPVAIMTMAYEASREGFQEFLHLFILLNLALMIFNLLPIPVLDGGHIAVCLIEGAIRRPIPPKILVNIYTTVAVLLICLVLLMTYRDVMVWWFKM